MFIRLGETVTVDADTILAVLDIDSVTVKKRGREIFNLREKEIVYCDMENLPLSCVVTEREDGEAMLYFSSYSTAAIQRHIEDLQFERNF